MLPRSADGAMQGALFREARDTSAQMISTYLAAAGFGDIPGGGPLALAVFAHSQAAADDLTQPLGITRPEAGQLVDALVQCGYLELRTRPGDRDGVRAAITGRGRAVIEVALNGVRAARWSDFSFRHGDIVISTWPKTGTTWAQMICALLIFQVPDLPAPLSELSPWLDLIRVPRDQVFAQLDAQEHRRFIKTHLPLNEIPVDRRATYIVIARHPLDAALSLYHQNNNKVMTAAVTASRSPEPDPPRFERPVSAREQLLHWINLEPSPQVRYHYIAEMLGHLAAAWARRSEPNVVLVHYEDLSAHLDDEMRRLAARLDITVPDAAWPSLVQAATFEHMRANPDRFLTSGLSLKDNTTFFRRGTSGEARELLTSAELARYHARAAQLAPADLLAWLHRQDTRA